MRSLNLIVWKVLEAQQITKSYQYNIKLCVLYSDSINVRHKNVLQIRAAIISLEWQNHWQTAILPALGIVALKNNNLIMQICYAPVEPNFIY